jgi:hypothetical protein
MAGTAWSSTIDLILQTLETNLTGTVFVAPAGTLRRLPDALGGDPNQWIKLQAAASKSKASFFELLRAKAHFLMLPETIVTKLGGSWRVQVRENTLGDQAAGLTVLNTDVDTVVINIPTASLALARAASNLGRSNGPNFDILVSLYHEMTHALIDLRAYYDDDFQKLCADGFDAYQNASGPDGQIFYPTAAFSEAASYYVDDKVGRWCDALYKLDVLSRNTTQDPVIRRDELDSIAISYNAVKGPYGKILGTPVQTPDLSPTLRDAIDKQILDSGPLTKAFDDTLLGSLRDALLPP